MIEIKNLVKHYGKTVAVDDLSFKIKQGELFAFLGVNGAGKSTTINILCGLLEKTSGDVLFNGEVIDYNKPDFKNKIGVVFQTSCLDAPLSVYDNLYSRASLYGICGKDFKQKLDELVDLFELKDILNRPIKALSGGQKRKVDIARALIHDPQILVLDEPTTGLDPQTRKTVWKVLNDKRKQNLTIILTTHYMEEANEADYVVIIDNGKKVASGTPLQLKTEYLNDYIYIYNTTEEKVKELGCNYTTTPNGFCISVKNTNQAKELLLSHPDVFCDFEIVKGKMDDVFLTVCGKELHNENNL